MPYIELNGAEIRAIVLDHIRRRKGKILKGNVRLGFFRNDGDHKGTVQEPNDMTFTVTADEITEPDESSEFGW